MLVLLTSPAISKFNKDGDLIVQILCVCVWWWWWWWGGGGGGAEGKRKFDYNTWPGICQQFKSST